MDKSIYEYISEAVVDGRLPEGFSLPRQEGEKGPALADGALEGIMLYHRAPGHELADDQTALDRATDAALAIPAARDLQGDLQLQVSTDAIGDTYSASFDCGNGRQLEIALIKDGDGDLRVQRWRMTTVVNDEPMMGNLLGSL